jgi:hypothetical protein
MKEKTKHQEVQNNVASNGESQGGNCPICGKAPCTCNYFPDVLRVEPLDYAPPEPDPHGSS